MSVIVNPHDLGNSFPDDVFGDARHGIAIKNQYVGDMELPDNLSGSLYDMFFSHEPIAKFAKPEKSPFPQKRAPSIFNKLPESCAGRGNENRGFAMNMSGGLNRGFAMDMSGGLLAEVRVTSGNRGDAECLPASN